jgi:hypothetical protein
MPCRKIYSNDHNKEGRLRARTGPVTGMVLILAVVLGGTPAGADIYRYYDDAGVLHITTGPPYKKLPASHGARNVEELNLIRQTIRKYAREYSVDHRLVEAMIRVESNFNPRAVSPKGARGLMQLMPTTARHMEVFDPHDIDENIRGGVAYYARLVRDFGSMRLSLAAYNAGETAVRRHQGIPPYRETQQYVEQVLRHYRLLRGTPETASDIVTLNVGGLTIISNAPPEKPPVLSHGP